IASTTMGSKGAKATAGADPSKSLQGTMPTSAPTQQAAAPTQISVFVSGVISQDQLVNEIVPNALKNQIANNDFVLIDGMSANGQQIIATGAV
ncbi:MAG: hypothetical protein R8M45_01520, partial [Ghiorsea sp.]